MARQLIDTVATSDDMDHLWGEVNGARDNTRQIKVSKEVLTRLLLDHGKLLNFYAGRANYS
jgi:hypothetical protein